MEGQHLVAMKEQIGRFVECYRVLPVKQQRVFSADRGDLTVNAGGVDGVGLLAHQAQQNGAVCAVAVSGQCKRAEQLRNDARRRRELTARFQFGYESSGCSHRTDGMRTRGADTNLEQIKEAGHTSNKILAPHLFGWLGSVDVALAAGGITGELVGDFFKSPERTGELPLRDCIVVLRI